MDVKFSLAYRDMWDDRQWQMIKDAVRLFLDHHNMNHVKATVMIQVGVKFDDFSTNGEFHSWPEGDPRHKKYYRIDVRKQLLFRWTLDTLMHELTHLYQMVSGKMERSVVNDQLKVWWRGRIIVHSSDRQLSFKEYRALPWEVDARDTAAWMVRKWYKQNPLKGRDRLLFWRY